MNRGLSHRFIPFGSSNLYTRFSNKSSAYPPFETGSASRRALISEQVDIGVPTCTSGTVSLDELQTRRAHLNSNCEGCKEYAYNTARRRHGFRSAVQLISEPLDVVQPVGNHNVVLAQHALHGGEGGCAGILLGARLAVDISA